MDGYEHVIIVGSDVDVGSAVVSDGDYLAGTTVAILGARDYVAISASWEASLRMNKIFVHVVLKINFKHRNSYFVDYGGSKQFKK